MSPTMYRFQISISDARRNLYQEVSFQTARHPSETLEHLYARVLAYSASYEDGLKFSQGLWEPDQPTIWKHSVIGDLTQWIDVAPLSGRKLLRAVREHKQANFSAYILTDSHLESFRHSLKGERTNWLGQVSFYRIDEALIEKCLPFERRSSKWGVTFIDDQAFIEIEGQTFSGTLENFEATLSS